jgi:cytochrome b subunit of formate dehydrogenase
VEYNALQGGQIMDSANVRVTGPEKNRRIFHWVVATAFIALFITGLVVFVPALSGLAAGGWTRLVHRIAAAILVGAPMIYALTHTTDARQWLREITL